MFVNNRIHGVAMDNASSIVMDFSKINYEINIHGGAIVALPGGVTPSEVDATVQELKKRYDHVDIDADGNIVING